MTGTVIAQPSDYTTKHVPTTVIAIPRSKVIVATSTIISKFVKATPAPIPTTGKSITGAIGAQPAQIGKAVY